MFAVPWVPCRARKKGKSLCYRCQQHRLNNKDGPLYAELGATWDWKSVSAVTVSLTLSSNSSPGSPKGRDTATSRVVMVEQVRSGDRGRLWARLRLSGRSAARHCLDQTGSPLLPTVQCFDTALLQVCSNCRQSAAALSLTGHWRLELQAETAGDQTRDEHVVVELSSVMASMQPTWTCHDPLERVTVILFTIYRPVCEDWLTAQGEKSACMSVPAELDVAQLRAIADLVGVPDGHVRAVICNRSLPSAAMQRELARLCLSEGTFSGTKCLPDHSDTDTSPPSQRFQDQAKTETVTTPVMESEYYCRWQAVHGTEMKTQNWSLKSLWPSAADFATAHERNGEENSLEFLSMASLPRENSRDFPDLSSLGNDSLQFTEEAPVHNDRYRRVIEGQAALTSENPLETDMSADITPLYPKAQGSQSEIVKYAGTGYSPPASDTEELLSFAGLDTSSYKLSRQKKLYLFQTASSMDEIEKQNQQKVSEISHSKSSFKSESSKPTELMTSFSQLNHKDTSVFNPIHRKDIDVSKTDFINLHANRNEVPSPMVEEASRTDVQVTSSGTVIDWPSAEKQTSVQGQPEDARSLTTVSSITECERAPVGSSMEQVFPLYGNAETNLQSYCKDFSLSLTSCDSFNSDFPNLQIANSSLESTEHISEKTVEALEILQLRGAEICYNEIFQDSYPASLAASGSPVSSVVLECTFSVSDISCTLSSLTDYCRLESENIIKSAYMLHKMMPVPRENLMPVQSFTSDGPAAINSRHSHEPLTASLEYPIDESPIVCDQWQDCQVIGQSGGTLQLPYSGVVLTVPPGSISVESGVRVKVSVCGDVSKIRCVLNIPDYVDIFSPLAEYCRDGDVAFSPPVTIRLPHGLPSDFDPRRILLYRVSRSREGQVGISTVPLAEGSAWRSEDCNPCFTVSVNGQLLVFTTSFSGYVCCYNNCGLRNHNPPIMRVLVCASQMSDCLSVIITVYVWDNRLNVLDFQTALGIGVRNRVLEKGVLPLLDEVRDSQLWFSIRLMGRNTHWAFMLEHGHSNDVQDSANHQVIHMKDVLSCDNACCFARQSYSEPVSITWAFESTEVVAPSKTLVCCVLVSHIPAGVSQPHWIDGPNEKYKRIIVTVDDQSTCGTTVSHLERSSQSVYKQLPFELERNHKAIHELDHNGNCSGLSNFGPFPHQTGDGELTVHDNQREQFKKTPNLHEGCDTDTNMASNISTKQADQPSNNISTKRADQPSNDCFLLKDDSRMQQNNYLTRKSVNRCSEQQKDYNDILLYNSQKISSTKQNSLSSDHSDTRENVISHGSNTEKAESVSNCSGVSPNAHNESVSKSLSKEKINKDRHENGEAKAAVPALQECLDVTPPHILPQGDPFRTTAHGSAVQQDITSEAQCCVYEEIRFREPAGCSNASHCPNICRPRSPDRHRQQDQLTSNIQVVTSTPHDSHCGTTASEPLIIKDSETDPQPKDNERRSNRSNIRLLCVSRQKKKRKSYSSGVHNCPFM